MDRFSPEEMDAQEWLALEHLSRDANIDGLSPQICRRLEVLGYAEKFEGGLLITDEGFRRIDMGWPQEKPAS